MRPACHFLAAAVLALLLGGLFGVGAAKTPRRQYYDTTWKYHKEKKYYTKTYYYRPTKTYTGTPKHQYVVYKPGKNKNWVYWYNPEKKKYWARCPTKYHPTYGPQVKRGKDYWSQLPEGKRKDNLDDVDDDDWGKVQANSPDIPGSSDGAKIRCLDPGLPPDLPEG
jgi:hypothetical protein